jgi:hypothetical protein
MKRKNLNQKIKGGKMAFQTIAYQIMIASPSEIGKEKVMIRESVDKWNRLFTKNYRIFLHLVEWETDTHPVTGKDPQLTIDEQILDDTDLLIVIFWKRLGSSGTVHELEKQISAGKDVKLYFAKLSPNIDDFNEKEYNDVKDLQEKFKNKALYFEYHTHEEFNEKFFEHLTLHMNEKKDALLKQTEKEVKLINESTAIDAMKGSSKPILENIRFLLSNNDEILLNEYVMKEVKEVNKNRNVFDKGFQNKNTSENFQTIVSSYKDIILNLQKILILLTYYGKEQHKYILINIISRIADNQELYKDGLITYNRTSIAMIPLLFLFYSSCITAIMKDNYKILKVLFNIEFSKAALQETKLLIFEFGNITKELNFSLIPGFENSKASRSIFIYEYLKTIFDDTIHSGNDFDTSFDKFEVFFSLIYADYTNKQFGDNYFWGPPGRFLYDLPYDKILHRKSVFFDILDEANSLKDGWPPIKAGLFNGSYQRFLFIADGYLRYFNIIR